MDDKLTIDHRQWNIICDVIGAAKVVAGRSGTIRSCLELAGQRKSADAVANLEKSVELLEDSELGND